MLLVAAGGRFLEIVVAEGVQLTSSGVERLLRCFRM
jgi:hypothetical protein